MRSPIRRPDPAQGRTGDAAEGRGRAGRRVLRGAGWGAAGLLGLVLVAATTTAVLDALDRRRVLPPGDLVELADGRRLHLHVDGPAEGSATGVPDRTTVVLEAGSGGFAASMAWLHRELAAHTTVVAYDRAGYGFSDPAEGHLDAAAVAADLHDALQRRGLHVIASLPRDAGEQHRARAVTAAGMRACGREVSVLPDLLDEVGGADGAVGVEAFGGLPVRVISATEPSEGESRGAREAMDAMHQELASRSPAATHVRVAGADHLSLVTDADHAREVAAAVAGLLEALTDHDPPGDAP